MSHSDEEQPLTNVDGGQTSPPGHDSFQNSDFGVDQSRLESDDDELTEELTRATPEKPKRTPKTITWDYDESNQELLIFTNPDTCDDISIAHCGLAFGTHRRFRKTHQTHSGSTIVTGRTPLKFRPKDKDINSTKHYGYFMSRKTCVLEHSGKMATILNEIRVFMIDAGGRMVQKTKGADIPGTRVSFMFAFTYLHVHCAE